ncbi:helix-turn-helix domain-containing protein [Flavihumibacter profundi]|jgi:AraC family transcriptional regulator|uniref:helix-turn-helix domain-containing protein n=1 Tax=Flavihumibacter profundi TaxID=2716883 RepID=UPI001CC56AB6|nr:AraC family transcriptional regulator [Flavihumibacter profundi]MBZ5858596.1 AraC family transcriptional regulator [Flavihumibacter profundi]
MHQSADILALARKAPVMYNELELLQEKEQVIPGSVQYSIHRYRKSAQWEVDDLGMLVYHQAGPKSNENYIELRFCISGNMYCRKKDTECDNCKFNYSGSCEQKAASIDVLSFVFSPTHLSQFINSGKLKTLPDDIVQFKHQSSFSKTLSLCSRTRSVLEALLNNNYSGAMENIFINAQMQMLLLYSLECMIGDKEESAFSCKFLANEADREKIEKARAILLQHIGEPITIKELSRKVAINECYLKKGFKEMYGTTVFDFYQSQRMEHARYLLYEKGLSVTEVSMMLGYSSISHFSTAFKKHTGLKPCELLLH